MEVALDPALALVAAERGMDLSPAVMLIGQHFERLRWLGEMLEADGMSPGASARAHARGFRFAAALGRVGYTVVEGPFGPRGGRRFRLESYGGLRAALLYRVMEYRDCAFAHSRGDCACFRELDVEQLEFVLKVHRAASRGFGVRTSTNGIVAALGEHGEVVLRTALKLLGGRRSPIGMPSLHKVLDLLIQAGATVMREALATFDRVDGTRLGGPSLEQHVLLHEVHGGLIVRVAADLFLANGGKREGGLELRTLVEGVAAAVS